MRSQVTAAITRGATAGQPVWLFPGGPIADPRDGDAVDLASFEQFTGAARHLTLAGRLPFHALARE